VVREQSATERTRAPVTNGGRSKPERRRPSKSEERGPSENEDPTEHSGGAEQPDSGADGEVRTRSFRALYGMKDVLWPDSARWEALVASFAEQARLAGYGLLLTPVLEEAGLFRRAVGDDSEVVGKEMYEFTDRGHRLLALRPEGTAPVVRAFIEHHPQVPWKVWYVAPLFRYERPQAGRYRQHHQLGIEALGTDDPDLDVEVICLAAGFYSSLGLRRVELSLNSMGCAQDRPVYVRALREFLAGRKDMLCDEHHDRFELNPLRVLDCKNPACIAATEDAPKMIEFLDEGCKQHFSRVREGLDALGVPYVVNPRLVRGLDYYTRTTFEFAALALESAQNAVGGGGRYDGLAEAIGGKPTPGIGFGMGIERLLLACDSEGCFDHRPEPPYAFVVDSTGGAAARDITAELRRAGISAVRAYDDRSLKAQMKLADRSGARYAVIVGPNELEAGAVALRDLRYEAGIGGAGEQETVARGELRSRLHRDRRLDEEPPGGG
jgi:histidyl-tRNA synthetase